MLKSYRLFTRSTRPSAKLVLNDILETADLSLVREWAEQRRSSTVREIVVFVDGRRHLTIDNREPECGDLVTCIGGERDGLTGTFEHVYVQDGVETYVVLFSEEDFTYAPAIRLYRRATR